MPRDDPATSLRVSPSATNLPTYTGPDAELLALCARLDDLRDEWQRLCDATSEEDNLTTPADHAWREFCDHFWPCLQPSGAVDRPAQLLTLRATTREGMQAKAAAIAALDDAGY